MDIMELGAIGELVGGVAVVASLIYVGLQVRQSNKQAQQRNAIATAEANRSVAGIYSSNLLALRDPDILDAYRKALVNFDGLPHREKALADTYLSAHTFQIVSIWLAAQRGLFDEDDAEGWVQFHVSLIKCPGGAQWWAHGKTNEPREFVDRIDALAREPGGPPSHLEVAPWWGLEHPTAAEA